MQFDIPHDKALHIITGALLYVAVHFVSGDERIGLCAVVVAGVGKEIYDAFHRDKHTPEVLDAVATVSGALIVLAGSLHA